MRASNPQSPRRASSGKKRERDNQFGFPFSVDTENSGTLGNNKPVTFYLQHVFAIPVSHVCRHSVLFEI